MARLGTTASVGSRWTAKSTHTRSDRAARAGGPGWWRREGHSLAIEDLDELLDELPARLVLGVGAYGRLGPDAAVIAELERRGVEVEGLPTDAAVRRYGELDERHTAAALHLTC
jgi:hypothetical protein